MFWGLFMDSNEIAEFESECAFIREFSNLTKAGKTGCPGRKKGKAEGWLKKVRRTVGPMNFRLPDPISGSKG